MDLGQRLSQLIHQINHRLGLLSNLFFAPFSDRGLPGTAEGKEQGRLFQDSPVRFCIFRPFTGKNRLYILVKMCYTLINICSDCSLADQADP